MEVQNIGATADIHAVLNLNATTLGLGLEHAEHEPEQFPDLIRRSSGPKAVTCARVEGVPNFLG